MKIEYIKEYYESMLNTMKDLIDAAETIGIDDFSTYVKFMIDDCFLLFANVILNNYE